MRGALESRISAFEEKGVAYPCNETRLFRIHLRGESVRGALLGYMIDTKQWHPEASSSRWRLSWCPCCPWAPSYHTAKVDLAIQVPPDTVNVDQEIEAGLLV